MKTINVKMRRWGQVYTQEVNADVDGGLAVHRSLEPYHLKHWVITHAASGWRIGNFWHTKTVAVMVRGDLLKLPEVNWETGTVGELQEHGVAIQAVLERYRHGWAR